MERRPQEFGNFVSHFIHIQIFQMKNLGVVPHFMCVQIFQIYLWGQSEHVKISLFISKQMKLKFAFFLLSDLSSGNHHKRNKRD